MAFQQIKHVLIEFTNLPRNVYCVCVYRHSCCGCCGMRDWRVARGANAIELLMLMCWPGHRSNDTHTRCTDRTDDDDDDDDGSAPSRRRDCHFLSCRMHACPAIIRSIYRLYACGRRAHHTAEASSAIRRTRATRQQFDDADEVDEQVARAVVRCILRRRRRRQRRRSDDNDALRHMKCMQIKNHPTPCIHDAQRATHLRQMSLLFCARARTHTFFLHISAGCLCVRYVALDALRSLLLLLLHRKKEIFLYIYVMNCALASSASPTTTQLITERQRQSHTAS